MSDQDFFFDEDEQKKEAPKKGSNKNQPKKKKPANSKPAAAPVASTGVSVPVVALIGLVALLVGVIVGFVLAPQPPAASSGSGSTGGSQMQEGNAPTLSDEQMEQGQMPEGHPDVGGMGGDAEADDAAENKSE